MLILTNCTADHSRHQAKTAQRHTHDDLPVPLVAVAPHATEREAAEVGPAATWLRMNVRGDWRKDSVCVTSDREGS